MHAAHDADVRGALYNQSEVKANLSEATCHAWQDTPCFKPLLAVGRSCCQCLQQNKEVADVCCHMLSAWLLCI